MFLSALREAITLILSDDPALWEIVGLSLYVSVTAVFLATLIGVPVGAWLGLRTSRQLRGVTTFIYTGMGLPPVVVGLVVFMLLSRQGALGELGWLFTPPAMILAQIILAVPLIMGVTMTSVRGVHTELPMQLRSLGATDQQILRAILGEARYGVIVGIMAGFGAAISEVGAVMLVGGNIEGKTRVLTTAIVMETRQGHFDLALALGIILLTLAFIANAFAVYFQHNSE